MSEEELIRGSGRGGKNRGSSGGASEADNTLFSVSKARIVDLISEGEISGLINGSKSIYLNETPIQDRDGEFNFPDIVYTAMVGTNDQAHIPGFSGTEQETVINVQVKKDAPGAIIRSFSSSTVDAVRVLVYTPGLTHTQDSGSLVGSSVDFDITIRKDSDAWSSGISISKSFEGKTTAKYERSYRIDIPSAWKTAGFTQIYIKVTRTTDDYDGAQTNNETWFGSFTEIIDNKLSYPNSALIAMQIDARQFSSIPSRGYEIKGVKIKIPSNYTPYDGGHCSIAGYYRKDRCEAAVDSDDTDGVWSGTAEGANLYSGVWDGTFTTGWTSNPAWILYDICTDERYGLGRWLQDAQMDKWALYEVARYCDAIDNSGNFVGVDNGWGGKEARFTCNLYLQGREEAYKVLNDIASTFRGLLYWQQGQITPVQDTPKDPVMLFSAANVIDGIFTYSGTAKKARHNVAHVTWNNPEDFYRQNIEYVEDAAGIVNANSQIFSTEVIAVGCTSQSQAKRVGKWILFTEKNETETVSFSTGLEGAVARPGDVIKIADSHRAGIRYGGRVSPGSTISTINLDSPTGVIDGKTYTLSLLQSEKACVRDGAKQTLVSSTTTAAATNKLIDTTQYFTSSLLGTTITRSLNNDTATVTAVDSTTQLTLNSNLMASGEAYTYQITGEEACVNANINNEWRPYVWVEKRDVVTPSATASVSTLSVTSSFVTTPTTSHMWILEEIGTAEAEEFRVLTVKEAEPNILEISALKYHAAKYNSIESNVSFSPKSTSKLPKLDDPIPEPTNLRITEELYKDSRNTIRNRVTFNWDAPVTPGTSTLYPYIASYYAEWRRKILTTPISYTNWAPLGESVTTNITIDDAPAGTVEFRVRTRRVF
jgi:predicted phage tail protein